MTGKFESIKIITTKSNLLSINNGDYIRAILLFEFNTSNKLPYFTMNCASI